MNVECCDCGVSMRMVDSAVDPIGRDLIAHLVCPSCGAKEQLIVRLTRIGVDPTVKITAGGFDPQKARERAAEAL